MCGLRGLVQLLYPTIEPITNTYAPTWGFENITQAEKCGIIVDSKNRRRRLIQNVERKWRSMNKLAFEIQNLKFGNKNHNYNSYNTNCFCSRNRDSHWFVCR